MLEICPRCLPPGRVPFAGELLQQSIEAPGLTVPILGRIRMLRGWSIRLLPCRWWSRFDVSHRRRFWTRHRLRAYIQFGPAVLPYRNSLEGLPDGGFLRDLHAQQMIGHSRSQGRCNEHSYNYSNIHEKVIFKGSVEERSCYLRTLLRTRSVYADMQIL